jgi:hypothetical protein
VCAEDGRLVRADQIGVVYVPAGMAYPEDQPPPDKQVQICTDLLGGSDGNFQTRCVLASCLGPQARKVIAGLAAALAKAACQPAPVFVFCDATAGEPEWRVALELPEQWLAPRAAGLWP